MGRIWQTSLEWHLRWVRDDLKATTWLEVPADRGFSAQGKAVWIEHRVCRWRCLNSDYHRRTLSDRVAAVATPYARRTSRQAQLLGHMAQAAGGSPAEWLLLRLGIRVTDDTILRQLLRADQGVPPRARIIGIDDWIWRKSQTYGTIIIYLERRAVIDVLENRNVVTCTDWLGVRSRHLVDRIKDESFRL